MDCKEITFDFLIDSTTYEAAMTGQGETVQKNLDLMIEFKNVRSQSFHFL